MRSMDAPEAGDFRVSSFSGGGNCVAVARVRGGGYAVKDTKAPYDGALTFDRDGWSEFLSAVKSGLPIR